MSVWGTILDLEDDAPYAYQGSHILPSEDDPRDGVVQLAEVPSHITRAGRGDQPEEGAPWPWMRMSLNSQDVILHARQVREVYESMGAWLEQVEGRAGKPCCGKDVGHYPGCAVGQGEVQ